MGLQEFDLDVQKKNYLMPWNLSAEKVKFALKSLLLIWDLMHYTQVDVRLFWPLWSDLWNSLIGKL